jgi:hypothetical protein
MKLIWIEDEDTAFWANRISMIKSSQPSEQYDGSNYRIWEETWRKYILKAGFPSSCRYPGEPGYLLASPQNILQCFSDKKVLQALALVVAWGRMVRTSKLIYTRPLQEIEKILLECILSIGNNKSIESSWNLLINKLDWSAVITSKCLHFLARSLSFEDDPPVPIDNEIILKKVWPEFEKKVKSQQDYSLSSMLYRWWDYENSWVAYNRYMTAIRSWAENKGWTTTQVENTLFQEYA